jgi:rod shape-determining protein MreC
LIVLLVGQLILLTAQIRNPDGKSSYLEAGLVRLVSPITGFVSWVGSGVTGFSENMALRRTLLAENLRLREEVGELREQSIRNFGLQKDLDHLAEALSYTRAFEADLQVADLVYIDHASWLQTAILRTAPDTVRVNQPVVSGKGLVGRVVLVTGPYAKVQLITDRAASVGVMIERTHRQGVIKGAGRGNLELDYVSLQADVRVGDVVVTAGIDGIYPRDIPVGTIAAAIPGDELFHEIRVIPKVDFGLLDQVYVLEEETVPEAVKEALPDAQP